jgi:hypothetical protein
MSRSTPQKQADGSYRLDCKEPLAKCLAVIEQVCADGYELLRAHENRRFYGPNEYNQPVVTSEVVARCGKPGQTTAEPAARGDGGAAPKPGAQACVPGATQACVGPAACRGGQQCLADGTAFGPCDCGATTPTAPTLPSAPGDGGVTAPN